MMFNERMIVSCCTEKVQIPDAGYRPSCLSRECMQFCIACVDHQKGERERQNKIDPTCKALDLGSVASVLETSV